MTERLGRHFPLEHERQRQEIWCFCVCLSDASDIFALQNFSGFSPLVTHAHGAEWNLEWLSERVKQFSAAGVFSTSCTFSQH